MAPEKSEAGYAGHDGGDAHGRRTLPVGAVQVAPFPSSFPQLVCRVKTQILSGSSGCGAPGVVTLLGVPFLVSLGWMQCCGCLAVDGGVVRVRLVSVCWRSCPPFGCSLTIRGWRSSVLSLSWYRLCAPTRCPPSFVAWSSAAPPCICFSACADPCRCARRSQVLVSGFVFRMAMVPVHSLVLGGVSPSFDGAAPFVPRRGGNESPSKMEEGVFVSAGAHGDCVRASPPAASFRQGPAGVAVWCLFLSEGSSSSCCVP